MAVKRKGKHVTMLLNQEQLARLNWLTERCVEAGTVENRNQLLRLAIEKMQPSDFDKLSQRT